MKLTRFGAYHPGSSSLHRLPPASKILGLMAWILTIALACRTYWIVAVPLAVALACLRLVRAPLRLVWGQVWPALPFVVLIAGYQWWAVSWQEALRISGIILCCILSAIVVTLSTRVSEMLDGYLVLLRPLEKLGVSTERIALLFALTLHTVPAIADIISEVKEALWSRGAGQSLRAFTGPVLVRIIRRADAVGEALLARGIDDSTDQ